MKDYSVVVTSCGRFDLLERTLRSLSRRLVGPLDAVIVIEDSNDGSVREVTAAVLPEALVLVNERRIGQLASIDRAYSYVRTPLVFHCEDDWLFSGPEFLEDSATLLDEFNQLSLISLRSRDDLNPLVRSAPLRQCDGVNYFRADPGLHPEYFGYSFNPGLRRMADYRRVGPFASFSGEREISYCFKRLGYTMGYLETGRIAHIGGQRHVDDPQTRSRPRNLRQRLLHSCRLRIDRLHRALFPSSDPAVQILRGNGRFADTRLAQLDLMHGFPELDFSASRTDADVRSGASAESRFQRRTVAAEKT